jgi:hypothetical protein
MLVVTSILKAAVGRNRMESRHALASGVFSSMAVQ